MENNSKNKSAIFYFVNGGPLKVEGNFKLIGPNFSTIKTENEIYLCRCGKSKNKPFCDNSFKINNFTE